MKVINLPRPNESRKKCPFYGFGPAGKLAFLDHGGQYCALRCVLNGSKNSPCDMENIDWEKCEHNSKENRGTIASIIANYKIFPIEFAPPNRIDQKGIPFKVWKKLFG